MKNILYLVICILVFNCSSDDDDNSESSTGVVGTWKITSVTVESANDYNGDGTVNPNLLTETVCSLNDLFVFNADGTGQVVDDGFNISLDVDQDSNFNSFYTFDCIDFSPSTFDSTWTQEGNSITVTTVVGTTLFTLESNQLINMEDEDFQVPIISSDGISYDLVLEDTIYILTKV